MDDRLQDVQVERPRAGAAVVVFTGEHDLATREAVETLLRSLVEENELVVVDFSEATFVDSSVMHVLYKTDRVARLRGSTFRLHLGTAPIVRKAFELNGLLEELDCAPTREEALRKVMSICPEGAQSPEKQGERDRNAWNLPLPQPSPESESSMASGE